MAVPVAAEMDGRDMDLSSQPLFHGDRSDHNRCAIQSTGTYEVVVCVICCNMQISHLGVSISTNYW